MKAISSTRIAALLLLPIFFACNKQDFKTSDNTEVLAGPPPPAIYPEPVVTVSTYAGNGISGSGNGKLLVAALNYPRARWDLWLIPPPPLLMWRIQGMTG